MRKRSRRNHSPAFKAKVAVEALKGEQTLIQLAERFNAVPSHRIGSDWPQKSQLIGSPFEVGYRARFCSGRGVKAMIDREHALPLVRQATLVGLSRGAIYYEARPLPQRDLALMRQMDELHLENPFAGSRMLRDLLNQDGHAVGRKHVATLMRRMGIEAIYRKKNTSRPHPEHTVYPYLLRHLRGDRPNQVPARLRYGERGPSGPHPVHPVLQHPTATHRA